MEITWRVISKGGKKGTGNKQHKWQVENRQGECQNSIGNVEAKEVIRMTHGHELQGGNVGGSGWAGWSGVKGGNWDNCNSIISKYIFKKLKTKNKKIEGEKIYVSIIY